MWKLTIEDDEAKQTSLPLAHDEYGIGRAENNAIRLTDRNVSRKHATLLKGPEGDGWLIRDGDSYNGTYVNGLRVAGEQAVASGDVVQVGDYRLELIDESQRSSQIPGGQVPVHQRPDRLVVVVGPTPGAEFPLDREYFTVGRAEDANISINHSSVSRFHAEFIAVGNGRYEVIDRNSANGIRINGQEIKRGFLEPGDALELGDVRLRFVGRGKIWRADQTQQLSAVASFESVAPSVRAPAMGAAPGKGSNLGRFVGIGAALGLVVIAVLLFAMRSGPAETQDGSTPGPDDGGETTADDPSQPLLDEAKRMSDAGFHKKAHEKALEIPEGSKLREHDDFKLVESRWAKWMFEQAEATDDLDAKYELLKAIATTETVDAKSRKDAIVAMSKLEEEKPELKDKRPIIPKTGGGGDDFYDQLNKGGATPKPTNDPKSGGGGGSGPPAMPETGGCDFANPDTYEACKAQLEPKAWGGSATEQELRMLKAICQKLGNAACRDKAISLLKQMEK